MGTFGVPNAEKGFTFGKVALVFETNSEVGREADCD